MEPRVAPCVRPTLCADQLPNYQNPMMGGMDRAGFKAMLPALRTVISDMRFDIENLVAEGDAVVARFTSEITLTTGKKIDGRGLTYYRLANGNIVEDDPIETPDLTQELAALMPQNRGQAVTA